MKHFYTYTLSLVSTFFLVATNVTAQWNSNTTINTPVQTITSAGLPQMAPDGSGGTYLVWTDGRSGVTTNIYAQHLNSAGVALWATNGIAICTASSGNASLYDQTNPSIIADGSGGAIIAWQDIRDNRFLAAGNSNTAMYSIYAQKVNSAGTAQWTANGVLVATSTNDCLNKPFLATDGAGGAFVAYSGHLYTNNNNSGYQDHYIQRINSTGTVWASPVTLVYDHSMGVLYPGPRDMGLVEDGSGGAYVQYFYGPYEGASVYLNRVTSTGTTWATPTQLTASGSNSNVPSTKTLAQDGSGGVISTYLSNGSIKAQRINSSGTTQWTALGVNLSPTYSTNNSTVSIVTNGSGGAFFSWMNYRTNNWQIYAQQITSAGAISGGWGTDGNLVNTAVTFDMMWPAMVSDGTNGAIIAWQNSRSGNDVYAQRMNSAGAKVWATTGNGDGVAIGTNAASQGSPTITTNGSNGALIGFPDNRNSIFYTTLYAQNVNADGTVGPPCIAPTTPTLSATSTSICNGASTTLSIASGTLNSATAWQWYTASCGGTSAGSGTSITVSPTTTTTYYARGEGGCVVPGTCASITITVNPSPTLAITPSGATTFCTGGSVILNGSALNNAIQFNGTNYVQDNAMALSNPSVTGFTVEGWMRLNNYTNYNSLAARSVGNQAAPFDIYTMTGTGTLMFYVGNGSSSSNVASTSVIPLNTWTHIATVYNPSSNTSTIYINGVVAGTASGMTTPSNNASSTFRIGARDDLFTNANATIDEVRIWETPRTGAQILASMNSTVPSNSSSLLACYRFDEITGTTSTNLVTGTASATLVNTPARQIPSTGTLTPYAYSWSTSASTASITATTTGTYTLTITNGNGCTAAASQVVTVNTLPTAAITGTATACTSVSLTATGGTGYAWSGGATPSTAANTFTTSNTYVVTVTGTGSCTATAQQAVVVNTAPTLAITPSGPTTFCAGGSVTLNTNTSALQFNGTGSVIIPHNAIFNISPNITIETWVKTTATGEQYLSTKGNSSWYLALNPGIGAGRVGFWLNNGGQNWLASATAINDGNWHHVAGTFDGTTKKIYIDGNLSSSMAATGSIIATGTDNVEIGSRSGGNIFNGAMDEFRIWNVARTQAQIAASMNTTVPPSTSGLVAYYRFDEASGNSTLNAVTGANAGTFGANPTWLLPSTSPVASSFSSYLWSTSATASSITVSTTGSYTVTATDSNGCTSVSAPTTVSVTPNNTITLSSAVGTDAQTRCINNAIANITYATTGATGASFSGLPSGVTGLWSGNVATISGTPTASGTFNYTITLTGGCGTVTATGSIIVTANNTISLTSAVGTDAQTRCINNAITNITYATTGATGASFSGLPSGVTGLWSGNVATISGTPTASGTFNYTVTLTGGCSTVTATGSIIVTANNTISLTSAVGTDAQTRCINNAITNITYATTGATGASFSGLPSGVTGGWSGNVATISGTPTASGTFNYTVTLTGGCGTITATGSIIVNATPTAGITGTATACTSVSLTATGGTSYAWSGGATPSTAANTFTTSNTYVVTVTGTGSCTATAQQAVTVNPLPSVTITGANNICVGATTQLGGANAATGGNTTTAGAYEIHTFTSSGSLVVAANTTAEVLVVAGGGGGGGGNGGGGGGAGGLVYAASYALTSGTKTVTIGNGGAGNSSGLGGNGGNSVFDAITAIGGGGGGFNDGTAANQRGLNGGSGGGNGRDAGSLTSASTTGQATQTNSGGGIGYGNRGGFWGSSNGGSGGGGAGGVGGNTFGDGNSNTGKGGVGMQFSQFAAVGGSPAGWFAGGGGGTNCCTGTYNGAGDGGQGGGGQGQNYSSGNAISAVANTGGGGGGCYGSPVLSNGGSGIVIVKLLSRSSVWSSSNNSVATVSSTGVVTGVSAGTATITLTVTENGCSNSSTFVVTVSLNTVGSASSTPTLCINTPLTNITHTTTGATGIGTATGLPTGVTASWASNTITISGTPTVSGTFNYSIPLTGGCGTFTATGTIVVTPNNTITLSSAVGTNAQTRCINNAITNITYATTGATGASFSGLPSGVTGLWSGNVATISGTPTASGTFNYTVALTGGCGTVTATGSIIVNPTPTAGITGTATACTSVSLTATGGTGYAWSGGATPSTAANTFTTSNTYVVTVTGTGGCTATAQQAVVVNTVPTFTTCPTNITQSAAAGVCNAVVTYTAAATGTPTPTISYTFTGATTSSGSGTGSGSTFNGGVTTVTLIANNTCGNSTACTFTITVNDTQTPTFAATGPSFPAPALALSNVSEASQYNLVYALDIPNASDWDAQASIPYTTNNTAALASVPFNRIAYLLQLDGQWVWTSMDAFTSNVSLTGIPTGATQFRQTVNNLNVFASAGAPVTTGTSITTGNIELWGDCYTPSTSLAGIGGNGSLYDFNDASNGSQNCYGSFQVHNWGAQQTLLSYSAWSSGNSCVGIGNRPTGDPDWTFANNAASFTTKKLYVLVRPTTATTNNLVLNTAPGSCSQTATFAVTASDNCGTPTVTYSPASGSSFPKGTTTVTATATDAAGNSTNTTFTVTVNDNQAPTLACVVNQTLSAAAGTCAQTYTILDPITDNCTGATWGYTLTGATTATVSGIADGTNSSAISFNTGVTTVTLTGTDGTNTATACTFTVTVNDVTAPSITCAADVTINTTPGLCTGTTTLTAPTATDNCSITGNALSFDGVNDNIDVAIDANEAAYTAEFWFKTTTSTCGLMMHDGQINGLGGGNDRHIYLTNGNIGARLWSNEVITTSGTNYADGNWHHIAYTFGTGVGAQRIYVDGVLKVTGTLSASAWNGNSINIGASADVTPNYFTGLMDEVRIWNISRTQAQILANMNTTISPSTSGLQAYYRFDQGVAGGNNTAITTATNNQGNAALNGNLMGFAMNGTSSNFVASNSPVGGVVITNNAPTTYPIGNTTVTWTATDAAGNTATCNQIVTVVAPEINVTGNTASIVDGDATPSATDHTDFGNVNLNASVMRTFTIQNTGTSSLTVSTITSTGTNASNFVVGGITLPATVTAGTSTTFTVTFTATAIGTPTATITVNNSDCNEATYDFAVQASVTCAPPVISISGITTACNVVTLTASAPGATAYAWSGGSSTNTAANTFSTSGTYTVTVTGTVACTSSASSVVTVNASPAAPVVSPASITACQNEAINLTIPAAVGGINYTWSPAGTLFTNSTGTTAYVAGNSATSLYAIVPNVVATYTVTATSAAGCTSVGSATVNTNFASSNVILAPSTAGTGAHHLQTSCEDANWTYYENPSNPGKYLFAINWNPDGGTALNATQKALTLNPGATAFGVFIDNQSPVSGTAPMAASPGSYNSGNGTIGWYESTRPATSEATFAMQRYWNVNVGGGMLPEPVNVRFYFDPNEYDAVVNAANAWSLANGGYLEGPKWFKTVAATDGINNLWNPGSDLDPITVEHSGWVMDLNPLVSGYGFDNGIRYVQFDAIPSFSGGGLAVGVGSGSALPLELLYFTGTKNNGVSHLSWATAMEMNTSHFVVERSRDGINFAPIGQVAAAGNSNQELVYDFDDNSPMTGNNYYRLRMVDLDASYTYSNIINLTYDVNFGVDVFPNPFQSSVSVDIFTEQHSNSEATIELFDMLGRQVMNNTVSIGHGHNSFTLDNATLLTGTYTLKITSGSNVVIRKIVKDGQ